MVEAAQVRSIQSTATSHVQLSQGLKAHAFILTHDPQHLPQPNACSDHHTNLCQYTVLIVETVIGRCLEA